VSRILLVDDDIAEISSVKRVLVRGGHQPALATNASDAQAAVAEAAPELLIVSATCENGEALALAGRLRQEAATAHLPILVLGDADPLPDGARRLSRPVDPEQLLAEVNATVGPEGALSLEEPAPKPAPAPAARPAPKPGVAAAARPGSTPIAKVHPGKAIIPPPPAELAAPAPAPTPAATARPAARGPAPRGPAKKPAPAAPPASASALSAPLPGPTAAPDAASSRRAAADALRARAEELRRSRPAPAPAEAPAASRPEPSGLAAPLVLDSGPAPGPTRSSVAEALSLEEGELDAVLAGAKAPRDGAPAPRTHELREEPQDDARDEARHRAADDALRALEEEASNHTAELARARESERDLSPEPPAPAATPAPAAPPADRTSEERALQEAIATARREAFEAARREAYEQARRELQEQAKQEAGEAARLVQAEARARQEAVQTAQREAQQLAQARAQAEQRARAAEEQLQAMRHQLEQERQKAEERVATVMQRAAEEEEAADELRRMAEEELRRRDAETLQDRAAEFEQLRETIGAHQAELAELRRRTEEEARLRAEAEAALTRVEEQRRREAERQAELQAEKDIEDLAHPVLPAAPPRPDSFTPPPFFAPFDGAETAQPIDAPPPDPAEEAARRRVAALRSAPGEELALGPPTDALTARVAPPAPPPPPPEEPARVIPPPPAPLRAGELADLPLPRLLAMAARAKLSGRIDLGGELSRALWFEEGRVVGAQSADPTERVEEIALRLGLITRDQHRQVAQATAALPSRRAALLLLERGFLKATELTGLVRRRTEEVVFGAFAEEGGRFRWAGVEVPPEERTALERGTLALAIEGVRRRWRAPRVDALLGGPATLLAPVAGAPAPAELGLGAAERRVVALADGLRALEEIVQASPLDPLSTRQVLAALVVVGALGVRVLHAGRPRGGAVAAIDLARVKDKLEQVRRADYFTVLGVGRLCTPHEVREAAERLLAEFDPQRFAGVQDEGLPARLAEIVQVLQDAREVLADDRLRDEYLRGLSDAG
jgi:CheY-like chemotaxis protein